MNKAILYLIFFFLITFPSISVGTSYYVDATNGSDSNDGLSPSTAWKTISQVNNFSFKPGDDIYFKRGKEWRETLVIPTSGSSRYPITFSAYGSGSNPIINGADIIKEWTQYAENIWQAVCVPEPVQVFFNRTKGAKQTETDDVNSQNDWYWQSDFLYIYSTIHPDSGYTNPGIEASARSYAVDLNGNNYLIIDSFSLKNSNSNLCQTGLSACTKSVIQNCTFTFGAGCALAFYTNSADLRIANNDISFCGEELDRDSIYAYGGCNNLSIYGNVIHQSGGDAINIGNMGDINSVYIFNNIIRDSSSMSIGIAVGSKLITGPVHIFQNIIFNHDLGEIVVKGSNVKIYRNNIYGGANQGSDLILCNHENASTGLEIFYNLIHSRDINGYSGIALWIGGSNSRIYNNVIYNVHDGVGLYDKINVLIKNNIIYRNSGYGIKAHSEYSAEIAHNCVYRNTDGNYNYILGSRTGSNGNISSEPFMTNPSNEDFSLRSISPCIDAGIAVALAWDYQKTSVPQGYYPDIGAYEYIESTFQPITLLMLMQYLKIYLY